MIPKTAMYVISCIITITGIVHLVLGEVERGLLYLIYGAVIMPDK